MAEPREIAMKAAVPTLAWVKDGDGVPFLDETDRRRIAWAVLESLAGAGLVLVEQDRLDRIRRMACETCAPHSYCTGCDRCSPDCTCPDRDAEDRWLSGDLDPEAR